MTTWIAFLRAVNLGGRRTFRPPEIVTCLETAGFTQVATHINTGNVRLVTSMRSRERVRDALERAFLADRGFEVPVSLLTTAQVRQVAAELDEVAAGHAGAHLVSFLRESPTPEQVAALEARQAPGERIVVRDGAAHLLLLEEVHRSRLGNGVVERYAGTATSRTRKVVADIAAMWC
ncbi:DUF1697 domain-containing protein [Arsenicicoccus dermatophilus]|uniref:DUF1697 domain-containing protein n=1 Tax=Arsenicicoccus dermatophilus TaxID=1076331 RepID=UPI0039175CD9